MSDHDPFAAESSYVSDGAPKAAPAPAPTPAAPAAEQGAPNGTSREVLAWVGKDKTRARQALDTEKQSDQPRKGLVNDLTEMLKK